MLSSHVLPKDPLHWRIGLIGYGEVGRTVAEELRAQGLQVCAYDLKIQAASASDTHAMKSHAEAIGVQIQSSHAQVCAHSDLVTFASVVFSGYELCFSRYQAGSGCFD